MQVDAGMLWLGEGRSGPRGAACAGQVYARVCWSLGRWEGKTWSYTY